MLRGESVCRSVVGRQEELDALRRTLTDLQRGHGCVMLIHGEAGIGKTRLVEAAIAQAHELGIRVVNASCAPEERGSAYRPVADALGNLEAWAPEAASLRVSISGESPRGLSPSPGRNRRATVPKSLFEAWVDVLAAAASTDGLLISLEDMHWSDDQTLELLRYTARRVARIPVAVVLTHRSEETEIGSSLSRFLADLRLRRLVDRELSVPPLTWTETRVMVREILSTRTLPPTAFVDELYSRTDGNPLFTEEIIAALDMRPDPDGRVTWPARADALPASLMELVHTHLSTLRQDTREVLAVAAAIGRRFDEDLLVRVSRQPRAAIRAALRDGVKHNVVLDLRDGGEYGFRHPLFREAATNLVLSTELRDIHASVAAALQDAAPDAEIPHARIARHLKAAGDIRGMLRHAVSAGHAASRAGAINDAALWYHEAVAAYDALTEHCPTELLQDLARVATDTMNGTAASAYARLVERFREDGDVAAEADALGRLAYAERETGATSMAMSDRAVSLLEPGGPSPELALALATRTQRLVGGLFRGDRATYQAAKMARDMAREVGSREAECVALRAIGTIVANGGDLARGAPMLLESIRLAEETGRQYDLQIGWLNLANIYMKFGDWRASENAARQGVRYASAQSLDGFFGQIASRLIDVLRLSGRWAEARQAIDDALLRTVDVGHALAWVQLGACRLAADERRWPAVMRMSDEIVAVSESAGMFGLFGQALFLRARGLEGLGNRVEALICATRALDLWRTTSDIYYGPPLVALACRLHCAAGDVKSALDLHRSLVEIPAGTAPLVAATEESAAHIAEFQRDHDAAINSWSHAHEIWQQLNRPFDTAAAGLECAKALLRRGGAPDRKRARDHLLAARSVFESLGAPHVHDVDELLRRSRLIAPAARRARTELSAREREITVHVAEGLSNRQIGEVLFLSQRTVENHVARILSKLGLSSRAQIAAYAAQEHIAASSRAGEDE